MRGKIRQDGTIDGSAIGLSTRGSNEGTNHIVSVSPQKQMGYDNIINDPRMALPIRGPNGDNEFYMVGASTRMREIYKMIANIGANSPVQDCILVRGETGTGKELVARAIHQYTQCFNRTSGPLVKVDMTALPENLIESELFGHEKGAFTGADKPVTGILLGAEPDGAVVIDEVSKIPYLIQAKLLGAIEDKIVIPVGSGGTKHKIKARIIITTNGNLEEMVKNNEFREDLYHRINLIGINLPSLRERKEDIPLMVTYFLEQYNTRYNKKVGVDSEAINELLRYDWPGNVRQLKNTVQKLVFNNNKGTIYTEEVIKCLEPEKKLIKREDDDLFKQFKRGDLPFKAYSRRSTEEAEKRAIVFAINTERGNLWNAAKRLGIDYTTLHYKKKEYVILTQDVIRPG